jgi:DNA-binding transcriptional LysR family regulator
MNMDLRSLKHVVVLARLLSYTKAAQELHLTQSALSRSIQAIEKNAQVKLFDRDRGGVRLTAVGRAFVAKAAAVLRDVDEVDRMLRQSANAELGEVAFGISPLAAQALLPKVFAEALTAKPELRTKLMIRNADALLPALLKEDLEFVISAESDILKAAPLASSFLGWFPLSLIVRAGHPLLQASRNPRKLDYPVFSPGQFSITERWPQYFRQFLNGPLHVIEDYGVTSRITEATDAIWLSSTFAAAAEIRAGRLREIPLPKGQKVFRSRMMMYSPQRRSLSPAALLLKEMFQARISDLTLEIQ